MKTCPNCQTEKPRSEFYNNRSKPDGLQDYCKPCQRKCVKRWDDANADRISARQAAWALENPRLVKRSAFLQCLRRHGLDEAQYNALLSAQASVCAICELPCPTGNRLAIDHCHITNRIRGLLCVRCNTAIGLLKDNVEILQRASEYLKTCAG